jgi:hypothetical protein
MITPQLEKLILCGKAFFKTAVVGGTKTTIDIDNDRFIIITDITFLPYYNPAVYDNERADLNTQLSIYGERGFNHYIFANYRPTTQVIFNADPGVLQVEDQSGKTAANVQKIDCYILHTTQVGFSFLISPQSTAATIGIAASNNPAFEPPLDYGKEGMPGALNVYTDITPTGMILNQVTNRLTGLGIGSAVTQQIQYAATVNSVPLCANNPSFPIANINYVEILGQPNNIGI